MEPSRKEDEGRAMAVASLAFVQRLVDTLARKGVLANDAVQAVFDHALTSLEHRVQDPAVGLTRRIVEGIAMSRGAGPGDP